MPDTVPLLPFVPSACCGAPAKAPLLGKFRPQLKAQDARLFLACIYTTAVTRSFAASVYHWGTIEMPERENSTHEAAVVN